MGTRAYAGGAKALSLSAPIVPSPGTFSTDTPVGWPDGSTGPFAVVIQRGTSSEEKKLITSRTGSVFTIATDGYDGTTAIDHAAAGTVELCITSIDASEANAHVNATGQVHGLGSGDQVVGSLKTQTLKNKSISGAENTLTAIPRLASPQIDAALTALTASDATTATALAARYTKTEADVLYAAEAAARAAADALLLPTATATATYAPKDTPTLLDAILSPKIAADIGATFKGLASQVGDLAQWQDSTAAVLAKVNAAGRFILSRCLTVTAGATTDVTAIFKRIASQTGDLTEWTDESNTVLAFVDKNGFAKFGNLPYATAGGRVALTAAGTGQGAAATTAVVFPVSRFSVAPLVLVTITNQAAGSAMIVARAVSVTSAGFTVAVFNPDESPASYTSLQVDWVAVQMLSGAAPG